MSTTMTKATLSVLRIFLAGHASRPRDALLMLAGFLIAASTLVLLLSIPAGIDGIAASSGDPRIAIVMSAQAESEVESMLSAEVAGIVAALPEVARDEDGRPLAAPQFLANTKLTRADGVRATVQLRGVDAATWALLARFPGLVEAPTGFDEGELLVGRMAADAYRELRDASSVKLRRAERPIRHGLAAGGGLWESEIWTGLATLQADYNAPGQVSVLWVALPDAAASRALAASVRADPRLADVRVVAQDAYYGGQVAFVSHLVRIAALGVSLLLGAGAVLVITSALDTALQKRLRETGTLRALGFPRASIGIAVMAEVALIGAIATALAVAAMYLALEGRTFGTAAGSQAIQARLAVTGALVATAFGYSMLLGLASAGLPTWRLAGGRLIDALRAD